MAKKKYSLEAFKDHFVEVLTTTNISSFQESELGISEKTQPFIMSGILLDYDENWAYLGDEEGRMSDSLNLDHIVNIGISKKRDEYDDMLDEAKHRGEFN